MKTVIIGGGISGLAAAYYLSRRQPAQPIILLEASPRFGGILRSEHKGGFCLEAGADAFVRQKKEATELCRELGLDSDLIPNRIQHQISYCWLNGELHPLPRLLNPPINLKEIADSPLLSEPGRRRACREPEIPPGSGQEESVASFIERRFGLEVAERIFEPLAAGVFGGSASAISLPAAFPRLLEYEQQHGHLSSPGVGTAGGSDPKRADSIFLSLRNGIEQIPARLVEALQRQVELRPRTVVLCVRKAESGFGVELEGGSSLQADSVVLATPAPIAGRLLQGSLDTVAELLNLIEYAPSILVCLGYSQEVVDRPGSGWLAPPSSGKDLLACTWVHQKFAHRCPPGHSLLRAYMAGGSASRLMQAEDGRIVQAVGQDLREIQGVRARPVLKQVYRLPSALPLYKIGHLNLIKRIQESLGQVPGLYCVGNYLDGVGIPDCLRQARSVAARVSEILDSGYEKG